MKKNTKLPHAIFDPTTKEDAHDRTLTLKELVDEGFVSAPLLEEVRTTALALFARGQEVAAKHGLLLVDTKYEFGTDGFLALLEARFLCSARRQGRGAGIFRQGILAHLVSRAL